MVIETDAGRLLNACFSCKDPDMWDAQPPFLCSRAAQRDHVRAFAQRVEVANEELRIMVSKSELLRTLVAPSSVETAAFRVLF